MTPNSIAQTWEQDNWLWLINKDLTWAQAMELIDWIKDSVDNIVLNSKDMIWPDSRIYRILRWKNKWRPCVIRGKNEKNNTLRIFFTDIDWDEFIFLKLSSLEETEIPWWKKRIIPHGYSSPYIETLEQYKTRWWWYPNIIRDWTLCHPKRIKKWDILATWEIIIEEPRDWYNWSVLLLLSRSWWVELAPRFLLALKGNTKFKIAQDLIKWDILATGSTVIDNIKKESEQFWAYIWVNKTDHIFKIPHIIPMALDLI